MIGPVIHLTSIFLLLAASVLGRVVITHKSDAQVVRNTSQIVLFILNLCIFVAYFIVLWVPGIEAIANATGLGPIPLTRMLELGLGIVLVGSGSYVYYITVSQLISQGNGFSSYKFTDQVVSDSIYRHVKNPMSVGYYLFALGMPFLLDSSYFLIVSILGFIPAQMLYVLLYEEKELSVRFGSSYKNYASDVPRFIPRLSREMTVRE